MLSLLDMIATYDTDKESYHRYISGVYEKLFAPWRTSSLKILEIGVAGGESLRLLSDAFPFSEIHGVDIKEPPAHVMEYPHFTVHVGDAYDYKFNRTLPGPFDIIIDDGPHTFDSQKYVLEHYWEFLNPGGLLIIEDVPSRNVANRLADFCFPDMLLDLTLLHPGLADDSRIMVWRK